MLATLILLGLPVAAMAAECSAQAQGSPPKVIELYTSEGCESCPPVDRWLSTLKGQPGVLPIAFHVDYFDRLGWKDRFSSAAHTRRQKEVLEFSGAKAVYTPQVLVDGHDRRETAAPAAPPSPSSAPSSDAAVQITLQRDGARYVAAVRSRAAQALALTGYWVLTENGLTTLVRGGENAGATLAHDFVVRDYRKLKPWTLAPGETTSLAFDASAQPGTQDVALVIVDSASGRPVQALRMPAC